MHVCVCVCACVCVCVCELDHTIHTHYHTNNTIAYVPKFCAYTHLIMKQKRQRASVSVCGPVSTGLGCIPKHYHAGNTAAAQVPIFFVHTQTNYLQRNILEIYLSAKLTCYIHTQTKTTTAITTKNTNSRDYKFVALNK